MQSRFFASGVGFPTPSLLSLAQKTKELYWQSNRLINAIMMSAQRSSHCKSCQSANQSTFNGEIAIHFPGLEGLDKPIVWVFPKLLVCLNCGFTEFVIPETELRQLEESDAADERNVPVGRYYFESVEVMRPRFHRNYRLNSTTDKVRAP